MHDFVTHLKDFYTWPSLEEIFPGGYQKNIPHRFYDNDKVLDQQLITKLALVDLAVHSIEIMWKPQGHQIFSKYGVIHVDSETYDSIPKIIRVINGKNSEMVWYDLNNNAIIDSHRWPVGKGKVARINSLDYVNEIYKENIKFSLVEVGTHMHAVDNPHEDRTAICCKIIESSTRDIIPYQEVKKRIKTLDICL